MRRALTITLIALLAALAPTLGTEPATADPVPVETSAHREATAKAKKTLRQKGTVDRVVDGDTVDVVLKKSGRTIRVRMVGIDTPEVHGTVECGGPEASRWLTKRLPESTKVILVSDPSQARKDQYGRALRYVIRAKVRKDMNRAQLARGNARLFVWKSNPFKRVKAYRKAQNNARDADRGIWGSC